MYRPFHFHFPTHICFGAGESVNTVAYLTQHIAPKKVFVVTYADFELPVLKPILKDLEAAGIGYHLYNKAIPNPRAVDIDAGTAEFTAFGADCILGIGGGSVIDTAKAIALLAANPNDEGIWSYVSYAAEPQNPAIPVGLVVSIASTGSESNESFVVTSPDGKQKMIYSHVSLRPRFSVCDPELSYTLPARQTALGAADIFSHVLEQYLHDQQGVETSDNMSLGIMKAVAKYGPIALADPKNGTARSNLMWASILAMSLLLGVGHEENWICHMLEHAVSAQYDLAHAAGMTAVIPAYLRFVVPEDSTGKIATLGKEVFGTAENAEAAIAAVEAFFGGMGLPVDLKEALKAELDEEAIVSLAENAIPWGSMEAGGYRTFTQEDAKTVFRLAGGKAKA